MRYFAKPIAEVALAAANVVLLVDDAQVAKKPEVLDGTDSNIPRSRTNDGIHWTFGRTA